jgi:nucleotide-binding universal stress UspA family protein
MPVSRPARQGRARNQQVIWAPGPPPTPDPLPTRILALASEPLSADVLRAALGDEVARDAEVLVVAPALMSRWRFVLADPDPAIERAEHVQEESVERLEDEGVDAHGETGESDPLAAIEDALATFDADEIVLFTHAAGSRNWREAGVVEKAEQRFPVPVRHLEVEG